MRIIAILVVLLLTFYPAKVSGKEKSDLRITIQRLHVDSTGVICHRESQTIRFMFFLLVSTNRRRGPRSKR